MSGALTALAQQFTVPFSGGPRPPTVRVTLFNGGLEVRGYDGKDLMLESGSSRHKEGRDGLKRIDIANGFSVSEDNNVITIHGSGGGSPRLMLQVPRTANLEIKCTNCGETRITDVAGDIDVNTINGGIQLTNVSGGVLAHSLNSHLRAIFDRAPQKPASLSSMNGGIDCTLPADTKADLKLKTTNGKIYTDFEVKLGAGTIMRPDRGLSGTINGGGVEIRLNTFNGSISVRRK